jgi:hypothetical protein
MNRRIETKMKFILQGHSVFLFTLGPPFYSVRHSSVLLLKSGETGIFTLTHSIVTLKKWTDESAIQYPISDLK